MFEVVTDDLTYSILVNDVKRKMQARDQVTAFSLIGCPEPVSPLAKHSRELGLSITHSKMAAWPKKMFIAGHPYADRSHSMSNTLGTDNRWADQIVPFNAYAFFFQTAR